MSAEYRKLLDSIVGITGHVAQEYLGRLLYELVQNAYDAHPDDVTDGIVTIVLDEGANDHGVLYVANRGRPFQPENFEALTTLAQSSKPVGEAIGNKGLGFRSVLQVCDHPEIYSTKPNDPVGDPGFGGYCFRFATVDDIRSLDPDADGDLSRRFPQGLLPAVVSPRDPQLQRLRESGEVTVIRLPLRSGRATEVARAQIQTLTDTSTPVMLFLDRLARIEIVHIDAEGTRVERSLTRVSEQAVAPAPDGSLELSTVTCDDRTFLVAQRRLPHEGITRAVADSIAEANLDPTWADWNQPAHVAVAVPLRQLTDEASGDPRSPTQGDDSPSDSGRVDGRTYTYLPMADHSPINGHVNAPFHTKLARTELDVVGVPLNAYLFREVAHLCLDAAAVLIDDGAPRWRPAVVDLIGWERPHWDVLIETADDARPLVERPLIPALEDGEPSGWGALEDVWLWQPSGRWLVPERISRTGAILVDPALDDHQLERVADLHKHVFDGAVIQPTASTVADWVEAAMPQVLSDGADLAALYDELHDIFRGSGETLEGRTILVDGDGRLRRAGPASARGSGPTVFLPPQRTRGLDAVPSVPRRLRSAFCYLHPDVPLTMQQGSTPVRTPAVRFLVGSGLVEEFRTENVVRALVAYTRRGRVGNETKATALEWVYTHAATTPEGSPRELAQYGVHVPTAKGWVPAGQATFGRGWPGTLGSQLVDLVEAASHLSADLASTGDTTLPGPEDFPVVIDASDGWVDFLRRLGVRDGLTPTPIGPASMRRDGRNWSAAGVARRAELPPEVADQWVAHVSDTVEQRPARPQTPYVAKGRLWQLPGQAEHADFPPDVARSYATVVASSIGRWPDRAFRYEFDLAPGKRGSDNQSWPTPAAAFLSRAPWLPVADPQDRNAEVLAAPGETWHFTGEGDERQAPRFIAMLPPDLRRAVQSSHRGLDRLVALGLRVWDDPTTAQARLDDLALLVEQKKVRRSDVDHVRKAVARAWSQLGDRTVLTVASVVVSRGRELAAAPISEAEAPTLYVDDGSSTFASDVLEAAGLPVVVADARNGPRVHSMLANAGARVVLTEGVEVGVEVDGRPVTPDRGVGEPLLEAGLGSLHELVALSVELQRNPMANLNASTQDRVAARLHAARLLQGRTVTVTVDGVPIDGRQLSDGSVLMDDEHTPTIVLAQGATSATWRTLANLAPHICDVVGQPTASDGLRAAALDLELSGIDRDEDVDIDMLAGVFRVTPRQVADILQSLRSRLDHLLPLATVAVGVVAGLEQAELVAESRPENREALQVLLSGLLGEETASTVLEAVERVDGFDGLLHALACELDAFNEVLVALGHEPRRFPDQHRTALRIHLEAHRDEYLNRVRTAFLEEYRSRGDLVGYQDARRLRDCEPDPAWETMFVRPPEESLQQHVLDWLSEVHGVPDVVRPGLLAVDEVRSRNEAAVQSLARRAEPLVAAWCAKHDAATPTRWISAGAVASEVQSYGAADFEPLDDVAILAWLDVLGLWPTGMPLALDLEELGLGPSDLLRGEQAATEERRQREREQRMLTVGGVEVDTTEGERHELAELVRRQLAHTSFPARSRFASLRPYVAGRRTDQAGGGAPTGRGRPWRGTGYSESQRQAVGLVGELVAFAWLQSVYPGLTTDAWVSGYRQEAVGGEAGDDGLGYDFVVNVGSRTRYYEVKATIGDDTSFELGASEVRAAKWAPKDAYRVLYVRRVLNEHEREVLQLRNPLEPEAARQFREVGTGLRFEFAVAGD